MRKRDPHIHPFSRAIEEGPRIEREVQLLLLVLGISSLTQGPSTQVCREQIVQLYRIEESGGEGPRDRAILPLLCPGR